MLFFLHFNNFAPFACLLIAKLCWQANEATQIRKKEWKKNCERIAMFLTEFISLILCLCVLVCLVVLNLSSLHNWNALKNDN